MSKAPSANDRSQLIDLGSFIRSQRNLAKLSQRELAKLTKLSDPYVSQLERGLHEPSVRVIRALGKALNVPVETMLSMLGEEVDPDAEVISTTAAIKGDPELTDAQKAAMLEIYDGFTGGKRSRTSE